MGLNPYDAEGCFTLPNLKNKVICGPDVTRVIPLIIETVRLIKKSERQTVTAALK